MFLENDWYRYTPKQLEYKYGTDLERGLSEKACREIRRRAGRNTVFDTESSITRKTKMNVIPSALSALLLVMLVIDGAVYKTASDAFAVVLVALGFLMMLLAFRFSVGVIKDIEGYSVPTVTVIREGKRVRVRASAIVPGDIVFISEGDVIPCDGRLIASDGLCLLEKRISGGDGKKDADFIWHKPGLNESERKNSVFARSVVRSGRGLFIACNTGASTLVMRRKTVYKQREDSIGMLGCLKRLSTLMTVISFVLLLLLTVSFVVASSGEGAFGSFLTVLAVTGTAMTEAFSAIVYIAVGAGVYFRHSKNGAEDAPVIKNVSKIEDTAAVTVLAVPKHSGICENELTVDAFYAQNRSYPSDLKHKDRVKRILAIAKASFGDERADVQERDAIEKCARYFSLDSEVESYVPVEHISSEADILFETSLALCGPDYVICVSGGARQLLARCTSYYQNGNRYKLSEQERRDIIKVAEAYEREANRTLAVASKISKYNNLSMLEYASSELCFEGLISMREPYAVEMADTVADLKRMRIRPVMFTSDHSDQSVHLSKKLGIISDGEQAITSAELARNDTKITLYKFKTYGLFRALTNYQKKSAVTALTKLGENVAFLGRELDDIALQSDKTVSFAICDTGSQGGGSEALKAAADVVIAPADRLGNGGLISAHEAILDARMICANVQKAVSYITASAVCRILYLVLSSVLSLPDLTNVQFIMAGCIIDTAMVFSLLLSKNRREVRGAYNGTFSKMKDILGTVVKGAFKGVFGAVCIAVSALIASGFSDSSGTAVFSALAASSVMLALSEAKGRARLGKGLGISLMIPIFSLLLVEYFALSAIFTKLFDVWLTGSMARIPWEAFISAALTSVLVFIPDVWGRISRKRK